jgi:hypothetical protein
MRPSRPRGDADAVPGWRGCRPGTLPARPRPAASQSTEQWDQRSRWVPLAEGEQRSSFYLAMSGKPAIPGVSAVFVPKPGPR